MAADATCFPAPETTLIADFEDGLGAAFGFGWQVASDRMQGGSSTARMSVESGALRVEGEAASGFVFPWAGATWFPGAQPMQPVDFSGRELLRFRARGDGRTYTVMLFSGGAGATVPPTVPFTASSEWTEVEIPLARFPTATPGIIGGVAFVAQAPPLGPFAFEVDRADHIPEASWSSLTPITNSDAWTTRKKSSSSTRSCR